VRVLLDTHVQLRALVAQARHLGVPIATADPLAAAYDVAIVPVGPRT
jgi:hypothetical protein